MLTSEQSTILLLRFAGARNSVQISVVYAGLAEPLGVPGLVAMFIAGTLFSFEWKQAGSEKRSIPSAKLPKIKKQKKQLY